MFTVTRSEARFKIILAHVEILEEFQSQRIMILAQAKGKFFAQSALAYRMHLLLGQPVSSFLVTDSWLLGLVLQDSVHRI